MSKPKLFISHSTNGLGLMDRSVLIREHLYSVLSKEWDVFLDKERIKPGDKWRPEIIENLWQAQAGIILFNKKATKSDWVTSEALILCFLKSMNPQFTLIPVLLDGKKIDDTCFKRYEPFQLNAIQNIQDDRTFEPEDFVKEKIIPYLDPKKVGSTPMNEWVTSVTGILKNADINQLGCAAEKLGLDTKEKLSPLPENQRKDRLSRSLAELMHYMAPSESVKAFVDLIKGLNSGANKLGTFLKVKWVENEAAEILLYASHYPEKIGILAINTIQLKETEQYLNRARIEVQAKAVHIFTVVGGGGDTDEAVKKNIANQICKTIFPGGVLVGKDLKELPLSQALNIHLKQGRVAICALPPEYTKERILAYLRCLYPKIIFIVQVPEKLTQFSAIGGKPLSPPLNEKKHNEFFDLCSDIESALKNKNELEK